MLNTKIIQALKPIISTNDMGGLHVIEVKNNTYTATDSWKLLQVITDNEEEKENILYNPKTLERQDIVIVESIEDKKDHTIYFPETQIIIDNKPKDKHIITLNITHLKKLINSIDKLTKINEKIELVIDKDTVNAPIVIKAQGKENEKITGILMPITS